MKFACAALLLSSGLVNGHNWLETPASRNGNAAATVKPCPEASGDYKGVTVKAGASFEAKWTVNHSGDHFIKVVAKIQAEKLDELTEVGEGALEHHTTYDNKTPSATITAPTKAGTYVLQYGWANYRNCVDLIVEADAGVDTPTVVGGCAQDCGLEYGRYAECKNGGCECMAGYSVNDVGVCTNGVMEEVSCATYCKDAMDQCTPSLFTTRAECLGACATFPVGQAGDRVGNTLHCRFHHLHIEGGDPAEHCPHASVGGGGKCEGGDFLPAASMSVIGEAGLTAENLKTLVETSLREQGLDNAVKVTSVVPGETEAQFSVILLFQDNGEEGSKTPEEIASDFHKSPQAAAVKAALSADATVSSASVNIPPASTTTTGGGDDLGSASLTSFSPFLVVLACTAAFVGFV